MSNLIYIFNEDFETIYQIESKDELTIIPLKDRNIIKHNGSIISSVPINFTLIKTKKDVTE